MVTFDLEGELSATSWPLALRDVRAVCAGWRENHCDG